MFSNKNGLQLATQQGKRKKIIYGCLQIGQLMFLSNHKSAQNK